MTDNNKKNSPKNSDRLQKPRTPKPETQGLDNASNQYASLEQATAVDELAMMPDQLVAADQGVLQQAIDNPRALTPQNTPSIQRTVGNRIAQLMIARAVAGQQDFLFAEADQFQTSLEAELEAILEQHRQQLLLLQAYRESLEGLPQPEANEVEVDVDNEISIKRVPAETTAESGDGLAGQPGYTPDPSSQGLTHGDIARLAGQSNSGQTQQSATRRRTTVNKPDEEYEFEQTPESQEENK